MGSEIWYFGGCDNAQSHIWNILEQVGKLDVGIDGGNRSMSSTSNKISNDTSLAPSFVLASFVMLSDGSPPLPVGTVWSGTKPGLVLAYVRHCCEVRFFSCDLAVRADVIVGAAFAEHAPWTWPV